MRRYGWTLSDVFNMPAHLFLQFASIELKEHEAEEKQKYELHSFTAWQITEHLRAMLNEKNKPLPFKKYLSHIGLRPKEIRTKEDLEREAAEAVRIAESIREIDKQALERG